MAKWLLWEIFYTSSSQLKLETQQTVQERRQKGARNFFYFHPC